MKRQKLIDNIDKVISFPYIDEKCDKCEHMEKDYFGDMYCSKSGHEHVNCSDIKLCYEYKEVQI